MYSQVQPSPSTYKAASSAAIVIAAHFESHIEAALATANEELSLAPAPSNTLIEAMLDVSFWTSLRKEEGHSPRISMAFLPPQLAEQSVLFASVLPLQPKILSKIAPGVERAGIHLGVWYNETGLYVWGTTRKLPPFCFVLEMVEPGLLVVKHRRYQGYGKFVNIAILKGDEVKIVDEDSRTMPDCPALLNSLLGFTSGESWNDSVNVLVQLATSMRAHARGGCLLMVPAGTSAWRESIVHPISYPVDPPFSGLFDLMEQVDVLKEKNAWHAELNREIDSMAGLTAIDGATLIDDKYHLLAFGAKIHRAETSSVVEQVMMTEPTVGSEAKIVHPTQMGGTRHLSAAQFVFDQKDAIALVASQDGRFTVFGWSPCEGMVHAHRLDTLLL